MHVNNSFQGRTTLIIRVESSIIFIAVLVTILLTCHLPAFAQSCPLDPKFEQTTLSEGMEYYTDRTYTLTSVPSQYLGMNMIKTPNAERDNTCGSDYVTFTMSADGTVYVGLDQRVNNLPDWMSGFTDTGYTISTSLSSQQFLNVYSKVYSAEECIDLGCNKGPGWSGGTQSNYFVFYGTVNAIPCTLDPKFEQTTLSEGMEYYTDRTYTLTSVPLQFLGMDMIKTPNDERDNTCGNDYITFGVSNDTTIYVAYDRRATNLPDWMSGFADTGEIINTSLSTQGWLNVYVNNYSAGECVNLGCNKGPGFSGSTVSNYVVFYQTIQVLTLPFSDDFGDGDANGWITIDDSGKLSDWQVINGEYHQLNGSDGALVETYQLGKYTFLNSGFSLADYRFSVVATHTSPITTEIWDDGNDIGVMFRYANNDNYYRLSISSAYGFTRLEKKVAGNFSPLATNARGYKKLEQLDIDIEVKGALIQVYINGDPIFSVSDSDLTSGTVALYSQEKAKFDDVLITTNSSSPSIVISQPVDYAVITTDVINVSAIASNVPSGGWVQFVLDDVITIDDFDSPYSAQFSGVIQGEHKVEAVLYDSFNNELVRDTNNAIGILGDYFASIGDSITNGIADTYPIDNISQLERVISFRGYEATLADLLTDSLLKPNIIFNEGVQGDESWDGAFVRIDSILNRHIGSNKILVLYGTNDSKTWGLPVPSGLGCNGTGCDGTFKGNMQALVDKIVAAGKTAVVGLVPAAFVGSSDPLTSQKNILIQEYNQVISSELTNIQVGPDFFSYFLTTTTNRRSLIGDKVHPNGLGMAVMAQLWNNALAGTSIVPFILEDLVPSTIEPFVKQNLLIVGRRYYSDETYTLNSFPAELDGGIWIMTANADKANSTNNYLSFNVDRNVKVYIAYDSGATVLPDWLSGSFTPTGLQLSTTNPVVPAFDLYWADNVTGNVTLGGNIADGANALANYIVIVVED